MTLEDIGLAVVRIEGKIDLLCEKNKAYDKTLGDHEDRLRMLEKQKVISPKAFWTACTSTALIVGALTEVLSLLMK